MTVVAGLDGCIGGWLSIVKDLCTGQTRLQVLAEIADLTQLRPTPSLVLIDIPIGLTDSGPRRCDLDARRALRAPRASSVFPAPTRPILEATNYKHACEIGMATDGRKLSQQAWAIVPKIRQVDSFIRHNANGAIQLREVHPEVCFWAWNERRAMQHSKKSVNGRHERETLVLSHYLDDYSAAKFQLSRSQAASDDLLDAFAALWTAERVIAGEAVVLPEQPAIDSYGLRMEMVA